MKRLFFIESAFLVVILGACDFANHKPILTLEIEGNEASIPITKSVVLHAFVIDEDIGDIHAYEWYVDKQLQIEETKQNGESTFVFTPNAKGIYTIEVKVTDGIDLDSESTIVTIREPIVSVKILSCESWEWGVEGVTFSETEATTSFDEYGRPFKIVGTATSNNGIYNYTATFSFDGRCYKTATLTVSGRPLKDTITVRDE